MKKKKETRGGAREGAGRKPTGTIRIWFRVPADKAEELKKKINELIKSQNESKCPTML